MNPSVPIPNPAEEPHRIMEPSGLSGKVLIEELMKHLRELSRLYNVHYDRLAPAITGILNEQKLAASQDGEVDAGVREIHPELAAAGEVAVHEITLKITFRNGKRKCSWLHSDGKPIWCALMLGNASRKGPQDGGAP